jgi:hypothetical protein
MDLFTRSSLQDLVNARQDVAVSIFMPTVRRGRDIRQNPLQWKNALKSADEQLHEFGLAGSRINRILDAPRRLADDHLWWENQSDGLAAFIGPDRFEHFRLPLELEPRVVVGSDFCVRPLLPVLQGDGQFYILAVSQNRVRLLRATRYSVAELDPQGLPKNLRDALNIDEYFASLQHHSTERGRLGRQWGTFHGHGGSDMDVEKRDEIIEYFRIINKSLEDFFREERRPLVFAGVDYLFPMFQEASSYSRLVEPPITGNPDESSAADLQQRAWSIVEPLFSADRSAALDRYGAALPEKMASSDLSTVLQAARDGRVDVLFVAQGAEIWGELDDTPSAVRITRIERTPQARDLTNYAVLKALLTDVTIYTVEPDRMPSRAALAAIFRYPA